MIFMDTLSEGSDIDLAEDLIEDSDLDSDYEPEEQDIDIHSEEEEECETPQRNRRKRKRPSLVDNAGKFGTTYLA